MKKGDIVNVGKQLSKQYFRLYLESIKGNMDYLEDNVDIIGFFDDEKEKCYRMIFRLPKIKDVYCEIIYNLNNSHLNSNMFKKIEFKGRI